LDGVTDYTEAVYECGAYFGTEGKVGTVSSASAAFVLMTCFYLSMLITIKYRDSCSRWIRIALAGLGLAAAGFLLADR
jgi:hypothetical protein